MKNLLLIFTFFCCQFVLAQQKTPLKYDSLQSNKPIQISKPVVFNKVLIQQNISDVGKSKQLLMMNNYNFNHSTSDVFTTAPKTIYNPYGTTNKNATIFNGTVTLLQELFKK